jgi:hypothetical protein
MHPSKRSFLTGLASLFAAPAIVRADSLMKLHQIPDRWATVWGVGWNFEVVEVPLWTPVSAMSFASGPHLHQFREVTEWVYTKPPTSLTKPMHYPHWHNRDYYINDSVTHLDIIQETGFTRPMGYWELREWQASQRPDLEGPGSMDWAYEGIRLERQASVC